MQEINYKLVLESKIPIPEEKKQPLFIPATSVAGAIRALCRKRDALTPGEQGENEKLLFGSSDTVLRVDPNVYFSNLECLHPGSQLVEFIDTLINLRQSREQYFPFIEQTAYIGKITFRTGNTSLERSIVLSTLFDLPQMNVFGGKGYKVREVRILDDSSPIAFISYSWEDPLHMEWVKDLALRLMGQRIDIVLDVLALSFNINAPQNEINNWMTQAINNADKIIAVLTPKYRQKAESGEGGVGFEYGRLRNEAEVVSKRLKRYVGVLRKGDQSRSLPSLERAIPIINMRNSVEEEEGFPALVQAITSWL